MLRFLTLLIVGCWSCAPTSPSVPCQLQLNNIGYADTVAVHLTWEGQEALYVATPSQDTMILHKQQSARWVSMGTYTFFTASGCQLTAQNLKSGGLYRLYGSSKSTLRQATSVE